MVAYDGSAGADAALARGLEIAGEATRELWLMSVQADPGFTPPQATLVPRPDIEAATRRERRYLARVQSAAEEAALQAGVTLHTETILGNAAKSIVEYAAAGGFDLLVIGQAGHSGVWGTFLGTTADKVVLTVQYLAGIIRDYFGDGSALGVRVHYSVEDVPLGTAGSVKHAGYPARGAYRTSRW